ncbi:MAG: hypothetical protein WBL88_11415, partial [Nitrososphaeraceae archaeon]
MINSEESVDITTFPQYQHLLIQNNELKEALEKVTALQTADNIAVTTTSSVSHNIESQLDVVDFEFPLPIGDVRNY